MSHRIVALARSKNLGRGPASTGSSQVARKAVLCSLADRADNEGGGIYPSVPLLARLAGCSERQVQRCLGELLSEGLIEQTGVRRCRGGYTREFRINVSRLMALQDVEAEKAQRDDAMSPLSHTAEAVTSRRTSDKADTASSPLTERGDAVSPKPMDSSLRSESYVGEGAGGRERASNTPKPDWQAVIEAVAHPWLDPNKHPRLPVEGAIVESWRRAGADLHVDIVPTVRRMMERKQEPCSTWRYFDAEIRRSTARRLAAEQEKPAITPAEAGTHNRTARGFNGAVGYAFEDQKRLEELKCRGMHDLAQRFEHALRTLSPSGRRSGRGDMVRAALRMQARRNVDEALAADGGHPPLGGRVHVD